MQKIIEGFSFEEEADLSKSFEGNIQGQKWRSIHLQMMQKVHDPYAIFENDDSEIVNDRMVKSKSVKSGNKPKFLINRKRVKSHIKKAEQEFEKEDNVKQQVIEKKEQQPTRQRVSRYMQRRCRKQEEILKQRLAGIPKICKFDALKPEDRRKLSQLKIQKQNMEHKKKLQTLLFNNKINWKMPQLKKLKIEHRAKLKGNFVRKEDFEKYLIIQKCPKTQN